jgi:N-acylneuraminate cytidylyltransferase
MNALNENLVIVIPARKNSKRLKNKNFKDFFGFPLFEWSLAAGLFLKQQLSGLKEISVVCTSDDDQILDLVKEKYSSSILAVRRKPELSDDNAILSDVIFDCIYKLAERHVIRLDDYLSGSFILLQPTSPIRLKDDLVSFCRQIKNLGNNLSMVSVNKNYSAVKDIYEIINFSEVKSHFLLGHIGKKLLEVQDIKKHRYSAFVDGSLYLGLMSMLKEKGFMPAAKTLAFPLSIKRSIDIDTEEEFDDALVLIKELQNLEIEYVSPKI